jgi:hypothetical protein
MAVLGGVQFLMSTCVSKELKEHTKHACSLSPLLTQVLTKEVQIWKLVYRIHPNASSRQIIYCLASELCLARFGLVNTASYLP